MTASLSLLSPAPVALDFPLAVQQLLAWRKRHQRDLPWRTAQPGARDPYQVWVSEIMLQQTRAEVVSDYYRRWLAAFPTLDTLAAADLQEVLKQWEGLGYYARARNLHWAAALVIAQHGGQLPDQRALLLKLPGIGRYTAGAILSLAFGQAEPVLDGNVKRLFSRLLDWAAPVDLSATEKHFWGIAQALVQAAPPGQAGALNEALMELGATVCTPTSPVCAACPLLALCAAAQAGTQTQRPLRLPTKRTPHFDVAAGVIWEDAPHSSRLLIAQRPHKGLLGGLWEFPGGKLEPQDADLAACLRREIMEELGMEIAVGDQVTVVRHAYTHFRITLHAFHARHVSGAPQTIGCADWRWETLDGLARFPFPVTDQKIIAALLQEATGRA